MSSPEPDPRQPAPPDPAAVLADLANYRMPFGKHKGSRLLDLPEAYLVWFAQTGFPDGKLGRLMEEALTLRRNGLERLLDPLRGPGRPEDGLSDRALLLQAVRWFSQRAGCLVGVRRLALWGGLCTAQHEVESADIVAWLEDAAGSAELETLTRRAQRRIYRGLLRLTVYVVRRRRCVAVLGPGKDPPPLPRNVLEAPPVVLFPEPCRHGWLPADVVEALALPEEERELRL